MLCGNSYWFLQSYKNERLERIIVNEKKNGGFIGPIIAVVIAIVIGLASCGDSGSKRDVAHDPDGFLGYSDSFWEWYADNN